MVRIVLFLKVKCRTNAIHNLINRQIADLRKITATVKIPFARRTEANITFTTLGKWSLGSFFKPTTPFFLLETSTKTFKNHRDRGRLKPA